MNRRARNRLIIVTLIIVVIIIVILAVAGSGGSAKTVSVAQAQDSQYVGKRIQVSGTVVDDSYVTGDDGITFSVSDTDDPSKTIDVVYSGAVPSTFGNGITAISTGVMGEDGTLQATELLTKCPSKYESAEGSLTVANLNASGDSIVGQDVKVAGDIVSGTLVPAGQAEDRFTLTSDGESIPVVYNGALPDGVEDGSSVIVSGSLSSDGSFVATDVALTDIGS